jgi:phage shock protein C
MKRLYKNDYDKKISGVCSGVAEYFGLDPTLVRIAWVIFGLMAGVGFWAYLACAIIMPKKSDIE